MNEIKVFDIKDALSGKDDDIEFFWKTYVVVEAIKETIDSILSLIDEHDVGKGILTTKNVFAGIWFWLLIAVWIVLWGGPVDYWTPTSEGKFDEKKFYQNVLHELKKIFKATWAYDFDDKYLKGMVKRLLLLLKVQKKINEEAAEKLRSLQRELDWIIESILKSEAAKLIL